jgi:enoyl-CoA hydratase/carnithine racemase
MAVVKFQREGSVGHIVLTNPPMNLINSPFAVDLRAAVQAASNSDIRVLLVRAEGPNWSEGGDVADFIGKEFNDWRTFIAEVHYTFRAIESLQIPTIAAVRGIAYGGAFELALACDFIVAADNAQFRNIESSVGSAPLSGGVQRLAERCGRARAAYYTMLSETMTGKVAGEIGVAAFITSDNEVESTALKLAERLSTGPTKSYATIRAILKAWAGGGVPGADSLMLDLTMGLHGTEDARNGRAARAEALRTGNPPAPVPFVGR